MRLESDPVFKESALLTTQPLSSFTRDHIHFSYLNFGYESAYVNNNKHQKKCDWKHGDTLCLLINWKNNKPCQSCHQLILYLFHYLNFLAKFCVRIVLEIWNFERHTNGSIFSCCPPFWNHVTCLGEKTEPLDMIHLSEGRQNAWIFATELAGLFTGCEGNATHGTGASRPRVCMHSLEPFTLTKKQNKQKKKRGFLWTTEMSFAWLNVALL